MTCLNLPPVLILLPNALDSAMAGSLAGVCGWIVIFPIDTVKVRIQSRQAHEPKLRIAECVRAMIKVSLVPSIKCAKSGMWHVACGTSDGRVEQAVALGTNL